MDITAKVQKVADHATEAANCINDNSIIQDLRFLQVEVGGQPQVRCIARILTPSGGQVVVDTIFQEETP
jgi:hypothetical protein